MELSLAPADIATLEAKTEEWIAALQLAGLSAREQDDSVREHGKLSMNALPTSPSLIYGTTLLAGREQGDGDWKRLLSISATRPVIGRYEDVSNS